MKKIVFILILFIFAAASCKKEPLELLQNGVWKRKAFIYLTDWNQPLNFQVDPNDTCFRNLTHEYLSSNIVKIKNSDFGRCFPFSSYNGTDYELKYEFMPDKQIIIYYDMVSIPPRPTDTTYVIELSKDKLVYKLRDKFSPQPGIIGRAFLYIR